jgi:hypothetical protein
MRVCVCIHIRQLRMQPVCVCNTGYVVGLCMYMCMYVRIYEERNACVRHM